MVVTSRRALPAALPLILLAGLLAGCGKEIPPPDPGSIKQFAALGDSYASGPGVAPVADQGCVRSAANYGSLAAEKLGVVNYSDATCGGATSKDLVKGQTRSGDRINDAQLDSVDEDTDLVTLGIGLNEAGLSYQVLYVCLPEFTSKDPSYCEQSLAQPDSVLKKALEGVGNLVAIDLRAIRRKAPNARIVLVGYPRMLPVDGYCDDKLPLSKKAADRLKQTSLLTGNVFKAVAAAEKVDYLDMYADSVGHDVCSADPWVNGSADSSATGEGAALHPRPEFMEAVAERIVALARK